MTREVEAAFEQIKHRRPSDPVVSMWRDVRACLDNIRTVEFYLGYLPEKPAGRRIDHEAKQVQLQDARMLLGSLALTISEGIES